MGGKHNKNGNGVPLKKLVVETRGYVYEPRTPSPVNEEEQEHDDFIVEHHRQCHHCRMEHADLIHSTNGCCLHRWCASCLMTWFGIDFQAVKRKLAGWKCPACINLCLCAGCAKVRKMANPNASPVGRASPRYNWMYTNGHANKTTRQAFSQATVRTGPLAGLPPDPKAFIIAANATDAVPVLEKKLHGNSKLKRKLIEMEALKSSATASTKKTKKEKTESTKKSSKKAEKDKAEKEKEKDKAPDVGIGNGEPPVKRGRGRPPIIRTEEEKRLLLEKKKRKKIAQKTSEKKEKESSKKSSSVKKDKKATAKELKKAEKTAAKLKAVKKEPKKKEKSKSKKASKKKKMESSEDDDSEYVGSDVDDDDEDEDDEDDSEEEENDDVSVKSSSKKEKTFTAPVINYKEPDREQSFGVLPAFVRHLAPFLQNDDESEGKEDGEEDAYAIDGDVVMEEGNAALEATKVKDDFCLANPSSCLLPSFLSRESYLVHVNALRHKHMQFFSHSCIPGHRLQDHTLASSATMDRFRCLQSDLLLHGTIPSQLLRVRRQRIPTASPVVPASSSKSQNKAHKAKMEAPAIADGGMSIISLRSNMSACHDSLPHEMYFQALLASTGVCHLATSSSSSVTPTGSASASHSKSSPSSSSSSFSSSALLSPVAYFSVGMDLLMEKCSASGFKLADDMNRFQFVTYVEWLQFMEEGKFDYPGAGVGLSLSPLNDSFLSTVPSQHEDSGKMTNGPPTGTDAPVNSSNCKKKQKKGIAGAISSVFSSLSPLWSSPQPTSSSLSASSSSSSLNKQPSTPASSAKAAQTPSPRKASHISNHGERFAGLCIVLETELPAGAPPASIHVNKKSSSSSSSTPAHKYPTHSALSASTSSEAQKSNRPPCSFYRSTYDCSYVGPTRIYAVLTWQLRVLFVSFPASDAALSAGTVLWLHGHVAESSPVALDDIRIQPPNSCCVDPDRYCKDILSTLRTSLGSSSLPPTFPSTFSPSSFASLPGNKASLSGSGSQSLPVYSSSSSRGIPASWFNCSNYALATSIQYRSFQADGFQLVLPALSSSLPPADMTKLSIRDSSSNNKLLYPILAGTHTTSIKLLLENCDLANSFKEFLTVQLYYTLYSSSNDDAPQDERPASPLSISPVTSSLFSSLTSSLTSAATRVNANEADSDDDDEEDDEDDDASKLAAVHSATNVITPSFRKLTEHKREAIRSGQRNDRQVETVVDAFYFNLHSESEREESVMREAENNDRIQWVVCESESCRKWRVLNRSWFNAYGRERNLANQTFFCGGTKFPHSKYCDKLDDWIIRCLGIPLAQKLADMGVTTVEEIALNADMLGKMRVLGLYYDAETQTIKKYNP